MKSSTIPRMEFQDVDQEVNQERLKVAKAARDKLGYKQLAQAIAEPDALLFALHQAGIDPLRTRQVESYKQSKVKVGLWSRQKRAFIELAAALAFVIAFAISCHFGWGSQYPSGNFGYGLPSIIFALVFAIRAFVFMDSDYGDRVTISWERIALSEYNGNVPEHAIAAAVQINEACPSASFGVDRLTRNTEHKSRPLPDPFLWVKAKTGELYYLYVWDEDAEYKF